jgi:hypothetical protein
MRPVHRLAARLESCDTKSDTLIQTKFFHQPARLENTCALLFIECACALVLSANDGHFDSSLVSGFAEVLRSDAARLRESSAANPVPVIGRALESHRADQARTRLSPSAGNAIHRGNPH